VLYKLSQLSIGHFITFPDVIASTSNAVPLCVEDTVNTI